MARTNGHRWRPWMALGFLLVAIWAIGPWALALLLPALLMRHQIGRPSGRSIAAVIVLCVAGAVLAMTQPPGSLPIPPGAGWLTTPSYDGRPANAEPLNAKNPPQNPHLAANPFNSMHNDAWATDAYPGPGPTGSNPQVDSAFYGILECATLTFDSQGRLVGLCGDISGPSLHLIDPDTLQITKSQPLPERKPSKESRLQDLCGGAYFYLDNEDRAVVATTDAKVAMFDTATLKPVGSYPVPVPEGDCLIALLPDWQGRTWYATRHGQVGWVIPKTGRHGEFRVKGTIANSLAADDSGLYVVSDRALIRFRTNVARPKREWSTPYDRGFVRKTGQLSQGSGTTPTLLQGGKIAITDNADPRMRVLVLDRRTGKVTCEVPVLKKGASATENSLVAVGQSLYVENNFGYAGPWTTMLGRSTSGGVAKVDTAKCEVAWTAPIAAPTSVPKASIKSGLLYVYEKRANAWGVNAWYLTALDLRTGARAFRVRTGIGTLFNNHYAAITLGPDGSAYVATLAGLVRVRDGQ